MAYVMYFAVSFGLHLFTTIGGHNATAVTKFLQTDDVKYKMALVTRQGKYIVP